MNKNLSLKECQFWLKEKFNVKKRSGTVETRNVYEEYAFPFSNEYY